MTKRKEYIKENIVKKRRLPKPMAKNGFYEPRYDSPACEVCARTEKMEKKKPGGNIK
jgi:hypothetical protein